MTFQWAGIFRGSGKISWGRNDDVREINKEVTGEELEENPLLTFLGASAVSGEGALRDTGGPGEEKDDVTEVEHTLPKERPAYGEGQSNGQMTRFV